MANRINLSPHDITVVTAPTLYPVSVSAVKDYLREINSEEDSLIAGWIEAATDALEKTTRRAFINTTFDEVYDLWPMGYAVNICLHRAPVVSVTSISYIDDNGDSQTWDSSNYSVDTTSEPGRIELEYSKTIPSIRTDNNAVTVRYVAGYGTSQSDVPELAKHWIYMWIAAAYCRRPLLPEETEAMARIADLLRYGL